jgi:hypothetical protein
MNLKVLRIMGLLITVIGFVLSIGAATFDIFTGGGAVGDSQIGAFFIAVAVLLFGFVLLQVAANKELKERISSIDGLHKSITAEPPKGLLKFFDPLGTIGAFIGIVLIFVLVLKDYEPLLTFNIGTMQMLAIFSGTALGLVGMAFMTMGNIALSSTLRPMVLQLEAFTKEEAVAEVPPGKPMRVKHIHKAPTIDADTGEVQPTGEVEVVTEVMGEEEPGPSPSEVPVTPTAAPGLDAYDAGTAGYEAVGATEALEETPSTDVEAKAQEEGYAEPEAEEEVEGPEEENLVDTIEPGGGTDPSTASLEEMTTEGTPEGSQEWAVEQEAERVAAELTAVAEKELLRTIDIDETDTIPGPELSALETISSEVSDTEEVETEEVIEEFLCPSCQSPVGEHDDRCGSCGVKFSEEEEMVMEETVEGVQHHVEEEGASDTPMATATDVTASPKPGSSAILEGILSEISRLDTQRAEEPVVEVDEAAEVPTTCPKCGRNLKPRWKSCPYCGLEFR